MPLGRFFSRNPGGPQPAQIESQQQSNAAVQQHVAQQSHLIQQTAGGGQSDASSGAVLTDDLDAFQLQHYYGSAISAFRNYHFDLPYEPAPRTPGGKTYEKLMGLEFSTIREVILADDKFNELAIYLAISHPRTDPKAPIKLADSISSNVLIVRNEKYVLNLDHFLEDAPGVIP